MKHAFFCFMLFTRMYYTIFFFLMIAGSRLRFNTVLSLGGFPVTRLITVLQIKAASSSSEPRTNLKNIVIICQPFLHLHVYFFVSDYIFCMHRYQFLSYALHYYIRKKRMKLLKKETFFILNDVCVYQCFNRE